MVLPDWRAEDICGQELLYQTDTYHLDQRACVVDVQEGRVRLDKVVFYPHGGGQAGDNGNLSHHDGRVIAIEGTVRDEEGVWLICAVDQIKKDEEFISHVNKDRRLSHARLHTAEHLLCAVFPLPVTGCRIEGKKATLDMNFGDRSIPTKEEVRQELQSLIKQDHPVRLNEFDRETEKENSYTHELSRLAAKMPSHIGTKLRIVTIGDDIDQQFCGGTHVKSTAEIGEVLVKKIENKGRKNRRITLTLA